MVSQGAVSHEAVWAAIDALAARHGLSPSALARRAGLDPTTFNPCKRIGANGKPRWPSTESLAKALNATSTPWHRFLPALDTARADEGETGFTGSIRETRSCSAHGSLETGRYAP